MASPSPSSNDNMPTPVSPDRWETITDWDTMDAWNYVFYNNTLFKFLEAQEITPESAPNLSEGAFEKALGTKGTIKARGLVMECYRFHAARRASRNNNIRPLPENTRQGTSHGSTEASKPYKHRPRNPLPKMGDSAVEFLYDVELYLIMEDIPIEGVFPTLIQCAPKARAQELSARDAEFRNRPWTEIRAPVLEILEPGMNTAHYLRRFMEISVHPGEPLDKFYRRYEAYYHFLKDLTFQDIYRHHFIFDAKRSA